MADSQINTATPEQLTLQALDRQIQAHEDADKNKSLLSWAVSQVWHPADGSLSQLQQLSKEAHAAESRGDTAQLARMQSQIAQKIEDDRKTLGGQGEVEFYAGAGLKTAALFVGGGKAGFFSKLGWAGLASTVGLYAADNAHVGDSGLDMGRNLLMGGAKGGLIKGSFHVIGESGIESNVVKGMLMGGSARGLDLLLSPGTYTNDAGQTDVAGGFKRVATGTLDPKAIAIDGALFGLAGKVSETLAGGAARPFYNTVATSGTLGLASGSYSELDRQIKDGNGIDWAQVLRRGLLEGAVYGVAGIPGGLAADPAFRRDPVGSMRSDINTARGNLATKVDGLSESVSKFGESFNDFMRPLGGLQTAYATAGDAGAGMRFNGERYSPVPPPQPPEGWSMASMSGDGLVLPGDSGAAAGGGEPVIYDAHGRPIRLRSTVRTTGGGTDATVSPAGEQTGAAREQLGGGTAGDVSEQVRPRTTGGDTGSAEATDQQRLVRDDIVGEGTDGRERELTPAEIGLANREAGELLMQAGRNEMPQFEDLHRLYTYLAQHPEVDAEMARLYQTHQSSHGIRRAIEGFYKPPGALDHEPSIGFTDIRPNFDYITGWLEAPSPMQAAPKKMATLLKSYVEKTLAEHDGAWAWNLRPGLEQYARLTRNTHTAYIIDLAFETPTTFDEALGRPVGEYERLAREFGGIDRTLPIDQAAQQQMTAEATFTGRVAEGRVRLNQDVLQQAMQARADAVSDEAIRQAADQHGVSADKVLDAAATVNKQVAEDAAALQSEQSDVRANAAERLAAHLNHPSADGWFAAWRAEAIASLPSGYLLGEPAIAAMPEAQVREFLAGDWSQAYGQTDPVEVARLKITTLDKLANRFGESPEMLQRVVELSKDDPFAVRNMLRSMMDKDNGRAYGDWVKQQLAAVDADGRPTVTSLAELATPEAMLTARLAKAFEQSPETVARLEQIAQSDPSFSIQRLLDGMMDKSFKGARVNFGVRDAIVRRLAEPNATAADLSIDSLRLEADVYRAVGRNSPEAAQRLWQLGQSAPDALQTVLKEPFDRPPPAKFGKPDPKAEQRDPKERDFNFAYSKVIENLALHAQSIDQLLVVAEAMKSGQVYGRADGQNVMALVRQLSAPEQLQWNMNAVAAVAARDPLAVPEAPRKQRDGDRGPAGERGNRPDRQPPPERGTAGGGGNTQAGGDPPGRQQPPRRPSDNGLPEVVERGGQPEVIEQTGAGPEVIEHPDGRSDVIERDPPDRPPLEPPAQPSEPPYQPPGWNTGEQRGENGQIDWDQEPPAEGDGATYFARPSTIADPDLAARVEEGAGSDAAAQPTDQPGGQAASEGDGSQADTRTPTEAHSRLLNSEYTILRAMERLASRRTVAGTTEITGEVDTMNRRGIDNAERLKSKQVQLMVRSLKAKGLIEQVPGSHGFRITEDGIRELRATRH
jgi:hypothetical protein